MSDNLKNKYFIKTGDTGAFTDITALVDGVRVLSVEGFFDLGKTVNVYTEQWVNSQTEDFLITSQDGQGRPLVVRENGTVSVTFIVGPRYADGNIDTATQHDAFVSQLTGRDVWLKSAYANRQVHCMCVDDYTPTLVKLSRGDKSVMTGTVKLHMLERPTPCE